MSLQSTITNVSYSNFGFVHAKRGEFVADFYQLVGQRKSFENRLTFGDVVGRSLVSCFLTHGVETLCQQNLEEHSEKIKNKTVGESNRKCGEIAFAFAWLIKNSHCLSVNCVIPCTSFLFAAVDDNGLFQFLPVHRSIFKIITVKQLPWII